MNTINLSNYLNTKPYGLSLEMKALLKEEINSKLSIFVGTRDQYLEYEKLLYKDFVSQEQNIRQEYIDNSKVLLEKFWIDAFNDIGIPLDHPKANTLKEMAWDNAGDEGLSDVYDELCKLATLII